MSDFTATGSDTRKRPSSSELRDVSGQLKPYRDIVVGVDFSPASWTAVSTAARWASMTQARLAIVHVEEGMYHGGATGAWVMPGANLDARLREIARHAGVAASALTVVACEGSPYSCLTTVCRERKADLLVLGSSGMEHCVAYVGGLASKCLRHATTDVLLVRENAGDRFQRIVACVDFSTASRTAVERAGMIAELDTASLGCLHVLQTPCPMSLGAILSDQILKEEAGINEVEEKIDAFVRPVLPVHRDGTWSIEVRENATVRGGVVQRVREDNTDIVVLGTHEKSFLSTFFMGNAAEDIINQASCSLLAVFWPPAVSNGNRRDESRVLNIRVKEDK